MLFQRRRRYRWVERKRTRKFRWLPSLLLLIGILVGLELLARVLVDRANLTTQLAFDQSPAIVEAYQLKFANSSNQPYATLPSSGKLAVTPDPLLGYRLIPGQKTEFWTINEQGFRDQDPLSKEKPQGEIRIFVLGGSMAFGQLSSDNSQTFVHRLETQLNEQISRQKANPDQFQPLVLPYRADYVEKAMALPPRLREGQYRVINAAVPGYTSGNELAQLVQQVAHYNPDFLIVLDSYSDLLLPSRYPGAGVPGIEAVLQNQRPSPSRQISRNFRQWFSNLATVRLIKYYGLGRRPTSDHLAQPLNVLSMEGEADLSNQLAREDEELQQRIQHYRDNLLQMVRWTAGAKKPLLIALEPEITGRTAKALTPVEMNMLQALGPDYQSRMQAGYEQLAKAATQAAQASPSAKVLNLYRLFESSKSQAFQNPTSLTDEANQQLADRLYGAIATQFALKPKPYGS